MRVTQSDGEWEKGSGGWRDKGQPLVSKGEGWTLGGSSDQKFFMASPYSPLTAVFLMTWEIRSVVGAEVAWRARNCPGAGERDGCQFTPGCPEAHLA